MVRMTKTRCTTELIESSDSFNSTCPWDTANLSPAALLFTAFSPMHTDEADFDTSVIILEFPSDILSPVIEVSAPIALRDDEINEADVQTFIIYLKVINSTNPSLIATGRIISQGRIINDDRKSL